MKKKLCVGVVILAAMSLLSAVPRLAEGLRARGMGGVNYGGVGFPLILIAAALWSMRRKAQ